MSLPQARLRSSIGRGNTEYSLLAWVPDLGQGVVGHPCQHGNEQWKEELMPEPGTSGNTSEADAAAPIGEVEAGAAEPSTELDVNFDEQFFADRLQQKSVGANLASAVFCVEMAEDENSGVGRLRV